MDERRAALAAALGFDPAAEGLDSTPGEAADLLELAAALTDAPVPEPAAAETDRLAAALAPLLPAAERRFGGELAAAWAAAGGGWLAGTLAAVRPQVRLLGRPFWIASATVVAAGLPLLGPGLPAVLGIDLTYAAFLVIAAPVLAAVGVAYAFRGAGTGMAEVELACPLTPAQLVLGRLFWVAAYDAALLAAASLASAGIEPGVRLGYLVLGWLAPMLLLAAGALALSLYVPPWVGATGAVAVWGAVLAAGWVEPARSLPSLAGSPAVLPVALALGTGALLLVGALAAAAPGLAARMAGLAGGEGM